MRPVAAIVALLLALVDQSPALAFSCGPPPDPWFLERVTVGAVALPPGVAVRSADPIADAAPLRTHAPLLRIANTSDTPLYLLVLADVYYTSDLPPPANAPPERFGVALPPGFMPAYRVQRDQAWYWGYEAAEDKQSLADRDSWYVTWTRRGTMGVFTEPTEIVVGRSALRYLAPGAEDRNRFQPARPANAVSPESQTLEATLVYGEPGSGTEQILRVPLRVGYVLNPGYKVSPCVASGDPLGFAVEALGAVGVLASCLALGWLRRRRPKAPANG